MINHLYNVDLDHALQMCIGRRLKASQSTIGTVGLSMVGVDASRLSPGTRITLSFYEAPWKRDVPVELVVQERPKLYGIYDMVLTEADFEELNEQIEHGNKPRLFMLRRNKLRGGL